MIFITELIKDDGNLYAGPQINALSWAEAEALAQQQGVTLVGELA